MSRRRLVVLTAAWCGCALVGLYALYAYELTPSANGLANSQWPVSSHLARDLQHPTLVVFFHPYCPCSRASLAELSKLAEHCEDRVAVRVVFVKSPGLGGDWDEAHLVTAAKRIPTAVVSLDPDCAEATRFGATTSGEALLYAADGRLVYQGGLTASRGHEGDNASLMTLMALIDTRAAERHSSPVYGCALAE